MADAALAAPAHGCRACGRDGAVVRKVRRALRRAGLLDDEALADTANAQPELAGLIAESVSFPKGRVVDPLLARPPSMGNSGVGGFDLHAGVAVAASALPRVLL